MALTIGRYQVRQKIGEGAFGTVYRALDPNLGREVAIKVLQPHALGNEVVVKRFQREAQVVAGMLHPHIVPVYDFGDFEGGFYIVSAFIKGQSLQKAIHGRQLEQAEAVRLAIQLLDALAHAHTQGILHRDVKPLNILLDEKGELYLMDFGLAGLVENQELRETKDGSLMGTPGYMAPEQAEGNLEAIGPGADQYSAAVVLYEMLTGRLPFEATNLAVVVYHVVQTPPPRPSKFRPDVDPNLEAMCLRGLAKKAEDRWPSCQALADALRSWKLPQERRLPPTADVRPGPSQPSAKPASPAALKRPPNYHKDAGPPTPTKPKRRSGPTMEAPTRKAKKSRKKKGSSPWLAIGVMAGVMAAILGALWIFWPGEDEAAKPAEPLAIVAKNVGKGEREGEGRPKGAAKSSASPAGKSGDNSDKFGKSPDDPSAKSNQLMPKVDLMAVKLFVPHKPGDLRQVKVNREVKIGIDPRDAPQPKKFGEPEPYLHEKTNINGLVRTLDVNSQGQETRIELTLDEFELKHLAGEKSKKNKPGFPRGLMVIGKRVGKEFVWSSPKDGRPVFLGPSDQLIQVLTDEYGGLPEYEADSLFGTDQKLLAGGTWTLPKDKIVQRLQQEGWPGLAGPIKTDVFLVVNSGTGKLIGLVTDGGKSYLDVEIAIHGSLTWGNLRLVPAEAAFNLRVPRDGATGPVKRVARIEGETVIEMKGPPGGGKGPSVRWGFSSMIRTEIEYVK